jgi:molecular chaperone IbpA
MRHYDLSPIYRSSVGFDRLFNLFDQVSGPDAQVPTYPPYNIERTGENAYRITVAVAGFAEPDITIETKENTLSIRGARDEAAKQSDAAQEKTEVLYQGIAARAFDRRFQLDDHVRVTGASLQNGLLHVDLVREIPETAKPRRIPIGGAKVVEAQKAA